MSFYDTSPLRDTIEELVDFDLINRRKVRLSLGTAKVLTGNSFYFGQSQTPISVQTMCAPAALCRRGFRL
ncbi:MAG: hypothetical protein MZV49_09795 [Rhodopseudomonas palustris]|nr:hypothetical protein [Rhodopseudomonas palustris]